jgi:putative nucleotidyltransferase with HDIG domain
VKTNLSTSKLKTLATKILDKNLRKKVNELLENPVFEIDGKTYKALPLETAPAGLSHHHNYPGGYIEHVTSTMNIALALCDSAEKIYHGKVNRDLVVAGVLLHDIFKTTTYAKNENGSFSSTSLAEYLDHLSLATAELVRRNFSLELVHIVAAHHGQYGPIRPRTLEALICHLADFTDSRLNGEVLDAAQYLTRKATGQELYELTSSEAFEIVHSKSTKGWESLTKTVNRIKQKRRTHKT